MLYKILNNKKFCMVLQKIVRRLKLYFALIFAFIAVSLKFLWSVLNVNEILLRSWTDTNTKKSSYNQNHTARISNKLNYFPEWLRIRLITFYFNIHEKLSIIRCNK